MTEIREGVKGWQEQVSVFVEEHRPLLEDPESGYSTLSRIYTLGAAVLTAASDEGVRVASETTRAADLLTAAIKDPHCSAGKVAKKEKAYKRLSRENDVMQNTFTELSNFLADVKARLDAEYEEGGTPKVNVTEVVAEESKQEEALNAPFMQIMHPGTPVREYNLLSEQPEPPKKRPWWKCILGIDTPSQVMSKVAEPLSSSRSASKDSEIERFARHSQNSASRYMKGAWLERARAAREKRESATPLESDPEDYQKLLEHYEELLVPLEDLFRTRADHPVPYDIEPELLIRWQETRETLMNKMAWCCRNMDAIELRNPHGISRELLDKRENLTSRRGELGE